MMERTRIAKELRDDDIRYLKDIADGKTSERRTARIIGDYQLQLSFIFWSSFGYYLFFLFIQAALLSVRREPVVAIISALICMVLSYVPMARDALIIYDYQNAPKIYPEINAFLGSRTNFVPSWMTFCLAIFFAVGETLASIIVILVVLLQ